MPTTPAKATKPSTPAAKAAKPDAVGARFPRAVSLKGGKKVELRLMGAGDLDRMLSFAHGLPADDLLFLRRNIAEPAAVKEWIADIGVGHSFTVLAIEGELVAGAVGSDSGLAFLASFNEPRRIDLYDGAELFQTDKCS